MHVLEYLALLYGIAGFYLHAKHMLGTLGEMFSEACNCTISNIVLCVGLTIFMLLTFTPVAILTKYPHIITTCKNITEASTFVDVPHHAAAYIVMGYINHACHSITRIFMIFVTVVVRSVWLNKTVRTIPRVTTDGDCCLITQAKGWIKPKWVKDLQSNIACAAVEKGSSAAEIMFQKMEITLQKVDLTLQKVLQKMEINLRLPEVAENENEQVAENKKNFRDLIDK